MRPSEPWSTTPSSSSRPSLSSLATSTSPPSLVGSAADEATSSWSPPTSEDGGGGISPFASPSVSPPRGGPAFSKKYSAAASSSQSMGGGGKRFEQEAALALAAEEGTLRIPPSQQGAGSRSLRSDSASPVSAGRSAETDRGGGGPTARTRAFASNATPEPTWDDVLSRAKLVLKQWKRVYETEGVTGYAARLQTPRGSQILTYGNSVEGGETDAFDCTASPTTFAIVARCSRVATPSSVRPGLLRPLSTRSETSSP